MVGNSVEALATTGRLDIIFLLAPQMEHLKDIRDKWISEAFKHAILSKEFLSAIKIQSEHSLTI